MPTHLWYIPGVPAGRGLAPWNPALLCCPYRQPTVERDGFHRCMVIDDGAACLDKS